MGKKVRHLEFYGFPDQNVFTSAIGSVDLSEINKINKEQDEEISELSGATKGKADLSIVNELSAKTEAFISLQSDINTNFANVISGNTERITALEEYDEEVTNKINEIITSVTSIDDDLNTLSGEVESIKQQIVDVSGVTEDIEALSGAIDTLQDSLASKLDKDEAEDTYAKKEDVYTKDEIDDIISIEQESISSITGDIQVLSGAIDTLQEEIDNIPQIDPDKFALKADLQELSGSFITYTATTDGIIGNIEDNISSISGDISSINTTISNIESDIEDVNTELGKKLDKRTFSAYTSDVEDMFNQMDRKKADKTDVQEVDNKVSQLRTSLNQEIQDRIDGDAALANTIDAIDAKAESAVTTVAAISGMIGSIDERLDQEIQDRINGDKTLVGTSGDSMNDDTIWGAKKYAVYQKTIGVQEANNYTDNKFNGVETYINNKLDRIDTDLAKKANKTYVDDTVNDKVGGVRSDLTNALALETTNRVGTDGYLQSQIDDLNDIIYSGWSADTRHIYNRLNVITTYTGETVDNYTNTGNGVLDVLHREFHELEDEIGIVTNPTLVRTNEYEVAFGTYNISNTGEEPSAQTAFSIGIGTSDEDRKNAVEIRKDGTMYLWIEGEFMKVNDLLAMLAHETYN